MIEHEELAAAAGGKFLGHTLAYTLPAARNGNPTRYAIYRGRFPYPTAVRAGELPAAWFAAYLNWFESTGNVEEARALVAAVIAAEEKP